MIRKSPNPIQQFLDRQGFLVLDGGLATGLEAHGCDINDDLWSAKMLLDDPYVIRSVHNEFLTAGADCIVSASYQVTVEGLSGKGLDERAARAIIKASVQLAMEARDSFWRLPKNREGRIRPLVAASVGPYGAYLADGSEYVGRYDLGRAELMSFHRERWFILAESGADLLACETIPSSIEAEVLLDLLEETWDCSAWISFSCVDGKHVSDGSLLREAILPAVNSERVVAIGVNCTSPVHVPELIQEVREISEKPIIVYPNSGEEYDPEDKVWMGCAELVEFGSAALEWYGLGARLIGGCCRTGPADVRAIRKALGAHDSEHRED